MDSIVVYLGSDHVIQVPVIDWRESCIRLEIVMENAVKNACNSDYTGVLNQYRLNLQELSVLNGGNNYPAQTGNPDVLICDDGDEKYLVIFSDKAIRQLSFLDADFVTA